MKLKYLNQRFLNWLSKNYPDIIESLYEKLHEYELLNKK